MKKSLLFLPALLIAFWCQSQSLQLSSYSINITDHIDSLLHSSAVLHNVGSNAITVRVDRTDEVLATNHYSYFCWGGQCYGPSTNSSLFTETIAAGDSSSGFIAYLQPASTVGSSEITYCFYDDVNIGDSVCITFNYRAIVTGINELLSSGVTLTSPFPNPANAFVQIGFNLSGAKNAKLVIYNMLGSVVREIKVTDKQKLITISTVDLKNGMYLYSLINDDKLIASKKMLVSH